MSSPIFKDKQCYTYKDYLTWSDEERFELIDGIVYDMSPAPSRRHQEISMHISSKFFNYLDDKPCKVYAAPFDVRLPEGEENDEDIRTVVQPDIVVVCDSSKLDEKGMRGAPDVIVEIISASTAHKDINEKFYLYEKHGIKEYWIIHPFEETVFVYILEKNGRFGRPKAYAREDILKTNMFPDFELDLKGVFAS